VIAMVALVVKRRRYKCQRFMNDTTSVIITVTTATL